MIVIYFPLMVHSWSIIVPSKNHKISVGDRFNDAVKLCYGSICDMAISEDFVVGPWEHPKEELIPCIDNKRAIPGLEAYYLITQKYIRTDHGNY